MVIKNGGRGMDIVNCMGALKRAEPGINKYLWIMDRLHKVNVYEDSEFRKAYNGFYRMRQRSGQFYDAYYSFMEENKRRRNITFGEVLGHLKNETGRMEASFSSKLAATINPEMPVWDKYVMKNMGIKVPGYSVKNRQEKIKDAYGQLVKEYEHLLESNEGQMMIKAFDEAYSYCKVTDIKKIDFILWQIR